MKKIFGILTTLILVCTTVFAIPVNAQETTNVSDFFKNYIDKCFANPNNVKVIEDEKDITNYFFTTFTDEYENNDLLSIQQFVTSDGVQISYAEFGPQTRATESKSVTYQHYQSARDTTGTFSKEWTVNMQCYITWDANKYRITNYNTPIIYLGSASWGLFWSPYITNVYTNPSVVNSNSTAITFSGGYTMMGSYANYIPWGTEFNFGSYYISDTFYV